MRTVTLEVHGLFESLDHLGSKGELPTAGVALANGNAATASVSVRYDGDSTTGAQLHDAVRRCGHHCSGEVLPPHACEPASQI